MADPQQVPGKDMSGSIPMGALGIIAMPGCEALGARINEYLLKWRTELEESAEDPQELYTIPGYHRDHFLLEVSCPRFGTGEGKGLLKQSVRGFDLYILSDVTAYQVKYHMYGMEVPMSPDDHYADLKRVIAAVGGKARRINVIMPFLYESRQHRRTRRESMDCAVMLQELTHMGVSNIITFDAHDPRVQNAIPLTGFESVHPTYQMLKALCRHVPDLRISKDHMMVISPDEGAISRNIYYSTMLGLDMGIFIKRRDYTRVVGGRNPIISHDYIGADVEGKDIIVADDIISTGESMLDLARDLKKRKAGRIFCACTFAFFTNGLSAFQKAYEEGAIYRVLATNLNYLPDEIKAAPWFIEVDMAKYISLLVATLNHDHSLHGLLDHAAKIDKLLTRYRQKQAETGIRFA
ncbi:MAG: ribose-phosphate pyrophosphokinase [Oscillospiraceae bacterium]|jgi:ribose-phosphate pyrophosphokinase|nr:ribose-phosphate pyrophosphokinase [Oscillospiraceae bacterium]